MRKYLCILLSVVVLYSCKKVTEETPEGPPVKSTLLGRPGAGVTDVEGNVYPTVLMSNGQEWMAQNLRTTKFSSVDPIPQIQSAPQWSAATGSAFSRTHKLGFRYPLNFYYDTLYGPVYNYQAAIDPKGICPTGWRVPTDEDWKKLEKHLGLADELLNNTGWRGDATLDLANKLMVDPNKYDYLPIWEGIGGINSSLLSMVSAGWIGQDGLYNAEFSQTYFWSQSDASTEDKGWARGLDAGQFGVERTEATSNHGYSIRCIKGEGSRATLDKIRATSDVEWVRVHPSYYTISLTTGILNDGKSPVTEVGYYWGTNPIPTIKDSSRVVTAVNGNYNITIKNLQPDKEYYFRAYAKNSSGIAYGDVASFFTGQYTSMQDQDNNVYKIKQIGSQVWMCENLKTTKKADGTPLLITTDPNTWSNNKDINGIGFKIVSAQGDQNSDIWYNRSTAESSNLCPTGWRVPSISDFKILVAAVGGTGASIKALKTTGSNDWTAPNLDATNSSGFSAQGKGYIDNQGNQIDAFNKGYFWSTTMDYIDTGGPMFPYYQVFIIFNNPSAFNVEYAGMGRSSGTSIRCVKN
jgi:uncharacterized protein (TIGR02145 family)